MTTTPQLSIVLPAYEEAPNLEQLLPRLHEFAAGLASPYEILVVDTETPRDNTSAVCEKHRVRYIAREGGGLYGYAIRTAVKHAQGDFVILMDADGSHNPRYLSDLWQHRHAADLVIASRYVSGGKTENPVVLIFLSLVVNLIFRFALRLKCYDVSNSFRLYRGVDFRALHLQCDHFDIVEEILVKLITLHPGYRIREIPFVFEKRKAGKTKRNLFTFALGYFNTLVRMVKLKNEAKKQCASELERTDRGPSCVE